LTTSALAQSPAAPPRDIDITAADGAKLRATYYPAAGKQASGGSPAVMLLHMCNTDRKSWTPVAEQLSATGISALTMDYRGFGDSGGPKEDTLSQEEVQRVRTDVWPRDIDAAYAWLLSQPGVNKTRIGAGGGSCGVNNAVRLASRHAEVRSLVLL